MKKHESVREVRKQDEKQRSFVLQVLDAVRDREAAQTATSWRGNQQNWIKC